MEQEDTGVRYCPNCGKADQADWRKYDDLIRERWVGNDETWVCDFCEAEYQMSVWNRQTTPPAELFTYTKPSQTENKSTFSDWFGPFVALPVFTLSILFSGYSIALKAQREHWSWPGVQHPVYTQPFSFDRLEDIDRFVEDLERQLNEAKSTQELWREKAQRLIGQPGVTINVPTNQNTMRTDGGIVFSVK